MKFFLLLAALLSSQSIFSQKQLVILKNGRVINSFKEGEYIRFVLKNHHHAEGHIVELSDFYMITSNDTIQLKDILKINISKHRGPRSWTGRMIGGFLLAGGIIYQIADAINIKRGVNPPNTTLEQALAAPAVAGVGLALLFIRPKYKRLNAIKHLKTVDYTSPFYQR